MADRDQLILNSLRRRRMRPAALDAGSMAHMTQTAAAPFERIAALLRSQEADHERGRQRGDDDLKIGICSSLSWGFLREFVKRLGDERQAPQPFFLEGDPQEVLGALRRGEIDVGFVYGAYEEQGLAGESLWREPILVLMAEQHRLAKSNAIESAQLRRETFLIAASPAERGRRFAELAALIGGAPSAVRWADVERETLINLVGLGFGLSLAVSSSLGVFYPGVVYRPVAGAKGETIFSVVWREDCRNSRLGPFLATLRSFAARWLGEPMRGSREAK
jgi:DNA-binding transcriptional LysR family regulator